MEFDAGTDDLKHREKKETFRTSLRSALWYVYGKRCAYTGERIHRADDVEIDHILPQRLTNRPGELAQARLLFGLPESFSILRNLENYVPTTRHFNQLKSDKIGRADLVPNFGKGYRIHRPYEDLTGARDRPAYELITHALALAKQNRDAVERMERLISAMERAAEVHDAAPPEFAGEAFETFSRAVLGRLPSGSFQVVDDDADVDSVLYSRAGVRIDCNLPRLPDMAGSALVLFADPAIRDALITLNHRDITTHLLPGFGAGHDFEERPFLVGADDDNHWIQLPHVRVSIPAEHAAELCDIVDRLAGRYLNAAEDVERHLLRSHRFPYAKRGYRLYRLPHWLWREVLSFGTAHSYDSGDSEWHVFDQRGNDLPVYGRSRESYVPGCVARFHAELDADNFGWWGRLPTDIFVCWDPRPLHDTWAKLSRRPDTVPWDAEEAHDWFGRLVSVVARRYCTTEGEAAYASQTRSSRWIDVLRRRPSFERDPDSIVEMSKSQRTVDLPQNAGAAFRSYGALRDTISRMQRQFNHGSHNNARATSLVTALGFLEWCQEHATELTLAAERVNGMSHALGKLYGTPLRPVIEEYKREVAGRRSAPSPMVDLALRAVVEVLKDPVSGEAEDALVDSAMTYLAPLYDDFRLQAYLERMQGRDW